PPPPNCVIANWVRDPAAVCDTLVSEDSPATLGFTVFTGAPIAGLQGRIRLLPPSLAITDLQPTAAAAGMRLAWQPQPARATFVLFSDDGTQIPPNIPCPFVPPCPLGLVFEAQVSAISGTMPPPVTFMHLDDLLVTDSLGHAVPECPSGVAVERVARICAGG